MTSIGILCFESGVYNELYTRWASVTDHIETTELTGGVKRKVTIVFP